jgi:hypothetical protein
MSFKRTLPLETNGSVIKRSKFIFINDEIKKWKGQFNKVLLSLKELNVTQMNKGTMKSMEFAELVEKGGYRFLNTQRAIHYIGAKKCFAFAEPCPLFSDGCRCHSRAWRSGVGEYLTEWKDCLERVMKKSS